MRDELILERQTLEEPVPAIREAARALRTVLRRPAATGWTSAIATLLYCAGCELTSQFDVEQCSIDADCNLLGEPMQLCDDARCRPGCRTNRQCAIADPRHPICPDVGAACVELTSEDHACSLSTDYVDETMGPLTARELLLVGAFVPRPESAAWLTLSLGAGELNRRGGLPDASGVTRPALVVACDDNPDRMSEALPHLMNDLRARAVLASIEDRALADAMVQASSNGQALFMEPSGTEYRPTGDAARWLWSLGAPGSTAAPAYPALIERAVRRVLRQGDGTGLWRGVLLVSAAREDKALSDAVVAALVIDGMASAQLLAEDRLRVINLDDYSIERRASQIEQLLAEYPPDFVALFASGTFPDPDHSPRASVLGALESRAAALGMQPYYLVGPRNSADSTVVDLARASDSLRGRLVGLSADRREDPRVLARLSANFASAFPEVDPSLVLQPGIYDALYYLTYSLAAAPRIGRDASPEAVLAGLSLVTTPGASQVDVGPETLDSGAAQLASGRALDLVGSTGPAGFDSTQGRTGPVRIFCLDAQGDVRTIATYDAASGGDGIIAETDASAAGCGGAVMGDDDD